MKKLEIRCIFLMVIFISGSGYFCYMYSWNSSERFAFYVYPEPKHLIFNSTRSVTPTKSIVEEADVNTVKKKGLLLFTDYRSGSSFLGEYFNQRSDAFYLYEPLLPFEFHCSNETLKVEYLRQLFNCNIEDQLDLFRRLNRSTDVINHTGYNTLKSCLVENVCFRSHMKKFCSRDACGKSSSQCYCPKKIDTTKMRNMCNAAKIVVIKVIRLRNIQSLKLLLEDSTLDIKILHLVRDPRGMYSSAENIHKSEKSLNRISSVCEKFENNWNYAINEENDWLTGKYNLVRYEDICRRPIKLAYEIYKFVGIAMTTEIKEWIVANSQADIAKLLAQARVEALRKVARKNSETKSGKENPTLSEKVEDQLAKTFNSPFATIRNSSANWRKWTTILDFRTAAAVQGVCISMISTLNYLPVSNIYQLKNTSSKLIKDFCPNYLRTFNLISCNDKS